VDSGDVLNIGSVTSAESIPHTSFVGALLLSPTIVHNCGILKDSSGHTTQNPQRLLEKLRLTRPRDDDSGIIACVELVGAISLLLTHPENFAHRKAFLFQRVLLEKPGIYSRPFISLISKKTRSVSSTVFTNL